MRVRRRMAVLAGALAAAGAAFVTAVPSPATAAATGPCGSRVGQAPQITHVVVVQMQNHTRAQVRASTANPYTRSLMAACGEATRFTSYAGTGGPNRMLMTAGNTLGVKGSTPPTQWRTGADNIFAQVGPGNWRVLAEGMSGTCGMKSSGWYWNWHNPAPYFTTLAPTAPDGQCAAQSVPLTSTPDLSAAYTFVIPNAPNAEHETSVTPTLASQLKRGDAWLQRWIPVLTASPEYQAGRMVVFVTWDNVAAGGVLPFLVLSPYTAAGTTSATAYDHASLLRASEELLGKPLLGRAAVAPSMLAAFGLR